MMADDVDSVPVIAVTAAVGAIVLLIILVCNIGKNKQSEEEPQAEEETKKNGSAKHTHHQPKRQKPQARAKKEAKHTFSHSWLAGTLKGHSGLVTGMDFSPNGKLFATTAEDRSVLIWNMKEFSRKEHKSVRANVEYDHGTQVKFSPDSKAFIVSLFNANTVRVIRMGKKDDGSIGNIQAAFDFPKKHTAEIINIGIASHGKYIMTCSSDTTIIIWDLKGEVLATIDTYQMNNSYGAVSPCGRFVGCSGFTSDVKVWEVDFDKVGVFKEVRRAFELKGHKAGVYSFSFNSDSTRMATVSKDGSWKIWNTNVEYKQQQDPHLLCTGSYNHSGPSIIALSPDARAVAIATANNINVYSALTTEHAQLIEDVHPGHIISLSFDVSGKYFVSAGDRQAQVFHNIVGYQATIVDLEDKKKKAQNNSLRDRIQQQIEEAKSSLMALQQ